MIKTPRNEEYDRAFGTVKSLIENFSKSEKRYLSTDYSESQVRIDFIDKFWTALGWDVAHVRQLNPYEQEVKVERNVRDSGRGRRADYAFLQPNFRDVRFFVEAKRPGGQLDTPDSLFQVIRYGWNSRVPLSVLTNFYEIRVLDCRYKPDIETSSHRLIRELSFRYDDFSDREKFARFYFLFSRDSSISGSLEAYADELPRGSTTASQRSLFSTKELRPVDDTFLEDLDRFRERLACSFKSLNLNLDSEQLTEVTQRTIDRFVFMRFLEDKLIEPDPIIETLGDRSSVWEDFIAASRRLNNVYNGIIFRRHALLDSPTFKVDEQILSEFRDTLAHTNSPYAFNYVPIHILGNIYERFLSKTIIATETSARVELKPENRKQKGVFYTPDYVVRYIVEQTVGSITSALNPTEVATKKFADISCGSGSFLLGVYDHLIRQTSRFFNERKNRRFASDSGCVVAEDGSFHLSLKQRREMLLANIYGVDLDPQAVEVAQLSLYLKLLEEETTESARHYQLAFGERLLPDLSNNIKCGNSLVEWDILDRAEFTTKEESDIRPFNFASEFSTEENRIFDAIVGNPPYVQLSMKEFREARVNQYLPWKYGHSGGRLNTFAFFVERARELCKEEGLFSYIIPNTFTTQEYYQPLRKNLLYGTAILKLTTPVGRVFKDAIVENTILVAQRKRLGTTVHRGLVQVSKLYGDGTLSESDEIRQIDFSRTHNISFVGHSKLGKLERKLNASSTPLGSLAYINQAIALKHDRAASLEQSKRSAAHHEILDGRHIDRYWTGRSPNYFRFDIGKIHSCKREDLFQLREKILFRRVGDRLVATLDTEHKYALNTIVVITPKPTCSYDIRYLLGLFNSNILNFFYKHFLKSSKKVFSEIQARQVARLPIPELDLQSRSGAEVYEKIISGVNKVLEARKKLENAHTEGARSLAEAKFLAFDKQIDQLVAQAFALDKEDMKKIESN